MAARRYDVIVIGTGAGGGTLLHAIAGTGKKILVLERGDFLPREKANWDHGAVVGDRRYDTRDTFRDRDGIEFVPGLRNVVGGNTKVWGAALLRMRPQDFGEVRHPGGISPAWPLDYRDFEPWYLAAESLYRVRGKRGADPTEGPSSGPYAYPPIEHEPRIARLVADLEASGRRPFELPLGLLLDAKDPFSRCIRCDTCDGFPCLVRGKADAEVICIEPALARPGVTLLRGATAQRLVTDAMGRQAVAVEVEIRGGDGTPPRSERFEADHFVVACGAIGSTALLLRSASDRHPRGLGNNSSRRLGKGYMAHRNSAVFALSRHENRSVLQKTFALTDHYLGDANSPPLGLVQPLNRSSAAALAAAPPPIDHPRAGDFDWLATHSLEFWTTTEDLPNPGNEIRLDHDGKVLVDYTPNNDAAHRRLNAELAATLASIEGDGFDPRRHFHATPMPLAVCSHQCGTMAFGDDPRAAVLDVDCRLHDVPNVRVVDASFFPSSSAVNPSLTIIANALRVGAGLAAEI
jgi:choline dehydrogenase-like flavoprotein